MTESAAWRRPGAVVRAAPADATPTGSARLRGLPRPAGARARAAAARDGTARAQRRWDAALREAYGYDLRERNCATELVRALDDAGVSGLSAAAVDGAGFVPRVSFGRVAASPEAARPRALPSYRRRRLAAMRAREPDLLVRLREDNVLTSTLRLAVDDEPAFAFFTDDTVLPRPLYGAANLAVGVAQSGVGLVTAPFDGARTLRRGLRGVLASVPELAFASVRTGRLQYDMDAATEAPR